MNCGRALSEFVDLLTVASQALMRIVQIEEAADRNAECYLREVEAIASRLQQIGEELRSSGAVEDPRVPKGN